MSVQSVVHPLAARAATVDRGSALPAWAQVERDVRSAIDQGVLRAGVQLPTENEMATIYRVSRITVRQALSALADQGYVERRQGSGTFVADRPRAVQHDLGLTTPWRDRFRAEGKQAESVHLAESATEDEPYELSRELTAEERAMPRLHLRRLHVVEGNPIGLTDSWVVGRARAALAGHPLFDASLSKTLAEAGIIANHIDHSLEVRSANSLETVLLNTAVDSQVLVDWSIWRDSGELLETSRTVWLGTRVRLNYTTDVTP